MLQNDQGFAEEDPSQLVDFNYYPCFVPLRKYIMRSKILNSRQQISPNNCIFINQQYRQNWINKIYLQQQNNIIYNNFRKQSSLSNCIIFDSQFESGNLDLAIKKKNNQYFLYMRPDTNTQGHFQWFYFKVKVKIKKKVTFTIKNFIKPNMLYLQGLKPYYRQKNKDQYKQIYQQVNYTRDITQQQQYNLTFSYNFQSDNQQVYFCSQPPYTFKHLTSFIKQLKCQKLVLDKSVLGIKIPYLVYPQKKDLKVVCVVIARQHPGESVGSWLMEGFLKKLENSQTNQHIRWVVIPMLNVDGVVLGNNRSGVLGYDFNRNWNPEQISKKKSIFPQTNSILKLIQDLKRQYRGKVKMFLDLHSHSSQPNVFTYGPPHDPHSQYFYQSKLFPQLLSRNNINFNLQQCSYHIKPDKKNTARSILFYTYGIPFVYTIQCTFGLFKDKVATVKDFIEIGQSIILSTNQFICLSMLKTKKDSIVTQNLINQIKQKYKKQQNIVLYDSDSQNSQQNDKKKQQFQQSIVELINHSQQTKVIKLQKQLQTIKQKRSQTCKKKRQLIRNSETKIRIDNSMLMSKRQRYQYSMRSSTQNQQITKMSKIKLPIIDNKNYQELDKYQHIKQMTPRKMNIKQIQKRLIQLKNSKIGKKILVINAYGV